MKLQASSLEAPPKLFARRGLYERFRQNLNRLGIRPSDRVVVGVSGGRDSMCLLHLLQVCHTPTVVAHLNHRLRGKESLVDEKFVRQVCRSWKIPLIVGREAVRELAQKHGLGIEESARISRYRFFQTVARQTQSKNVWVAHHQHDQAETVLLKILFGTSNPHSWGMKMIRPFPQLTWKKTSIYHQKNSLQLIRPLLNCSTEEIELYCCQNHIPHRIDSSNLDTQYPRNWIRHRLLPYIQRGLKRNVVKTLARFGEHTPPV